MNTKDKGDVTEAMVLAQLVKDGIPVLTPFGDNQRYDLVAETEPGVFVRIQCKTGRLRDGVVSFSTCSSSLHRGGVAKSYHGEADAFGVYCPDNDKVYIVPVNETGNKKGTLRVTLTKNNQSKLVRLASTYVCN